MTPTEEWGRVEVCLSGVWSSICGSNWSIEEATVVCRQLGYASGTTVRHKYSVFMES